MEKPADSRVQRPCEACGRILSISFIRDKGSNSSLNVSIACPHSACRASQEIRINGNLVNVKLA
jgi:hypothetical protein